MRVTKTIREYVEHEIYNKYQEKMDQVAYDYNKERDNLVEKVEKIMREASAKAEELIVQAGFEPKYSYREHNSLFSFTGKIIKESEEERINNATTDLWKKREDKIKQVLFDLEMGDTAKAELKEILDNIVVD